MLEPIADSHLQLLSRSACLLFVQKICHAFQSQVIPQLCLLRVPRLEIRNVRALGKLQRAV